MRGTRDTSFPAPNSWAAKWFGGTGAKPYFNGTILLNNSGVRSVLPRSEVDTSDGIHIPASLQGSTLADLPREISDFVV